MPPWRAKTCKFSTGPELDAKICDVVGFYLHPPKKAVVLCVDEKPQMQALERTAPVLPTRPGQPEKHTHDYRRHGCAAVEVTTGQVTDACLERHRHQEFLTFPGQVAKGYPRRPLPVVGDNYTTHPAVRAWLERHPRVQLHCPRPRGPGCTRWRRSSPSSPGTCCAAAASPPAPT